MSDKAAAFRQLVQRDYDLIGELGRAPEGESILARERATGQLVALRLDKQHPGGQPAVNVTRLLGSSVPATARICSHCRAAILDWRRFCPSCGRDQAGVPLPADRVPSLLEAAVRESENSLDVLGQMPMAEGGAPLYFASERTTGRIVAFNLTQKDERNADRYAVSVTSVLKIPSTPANSAHDSFTHLFYSAESDPRFRALQSKGPAQGAAEKTSDDVKVCPACSKEYDTQTRFCPDDGSVLRHRRQAESLVGEVIADRYHILSKIGQGGMGQVYLAEHVRMGRRCAIKVLNRSLTHDVDAVNRFSREAANAARINDENVADIYDFGESRDHGIYLAMEYVEGEPLSRILDREGRLSVARTLRIASKVARGLVAAHRGGVIHRDLTPNNIVIGPGEDGECVKIVDFGIAKALQDSNSRVTKTGFVVGTPQYMSPEQLIGEAVDARSDIYQLGCILFEMLTGTRPFVNPDGTDMFTRRLSEPPPHPRDRVPELPLEVDDVVVRTMAMRREERYESAAVLRTLIDGLLWQFGGSESPSVAATTHPGGGSRPDTPQRSPVSGPAPETPRVGTGGRVVGQPNTPPQQASGFPEFGEAFVRSGPFAGAASSAERLSMHTAGDVPHAQTSRRKWRLAVPLIAVLIVGSAIAVPAISKLMRSDPPPPSGTTEPPISESKPVIPTPPEPTDPPADKKVQTSGGSQGSSATKPESPKAQTVARNPQGILKLSGELPRDAVIRINGSRVSIGSAGLALNPGRYALEVSATGFESVRDSVQIDPDATNIFALTFRRVEVQDPKPDAKPQQAPATAVFSPATASTEIDNVLKAFLQALTAGSEAQMRALFPAMTELQARDLLGLRREGRTFELQFQGARRIDPAGTLTQFFLWLHEPGKPPVPVPYEARLSFQSTGWQLTQFGRRQ